MNELFNLSSEGALVGKAAGNSVRTSIKGRSASDNTLSAVIGAVVQLTNGDHVETGTLFGGSAMVAALCMEDHRKVVTIDPLNGYYGEGEVDPKSGLIPSLEILIENLSKVPTFGKIEVIQKPSSPWPAELEKRKFSSALIDGDHSYMGCTYDWAKLSQLVSRYIIFDNVDQSNPGVVKVFSEAVNYAAWRPVLLHNGVGVVERGKWWLRDG